MDDDAMLDDLTRALGLLRERNPEGFTIVILESAGIRVTHVDVDYTRPRTADELLRGHFFDPKVGDIVSTHCPACGHLAHDDRPVTGCVAHVRPASAPGLGSATHSAVLCGCLTRADGRYGGR